MELLKPSSEAPREFGLPELLPAGRRKQLPRSCGDFVAARHVQLLAEPGTPGLPKAPNQFKLPFCRSL